MTDETDTTSEVARVLNLHASFKASAEIQDPNTPWYWECDGCDARLALSGTYGRPEVVAALAKHQAAALAEAGLLRAFDPDAECGVCGGTRDRAEIWRREANRMDYRMSRLTEERAAECIGNAFERRASDLTVRDAARRVVAMVQAEPPGAQIATHAPAEQPQPASGGKREGA